MSDFKIGDWVTYGWEVYYQIKVIKDNRWDYDTHFDNGKIHKSYIEDDFSAEFDDVRKITLIEKILIGIPD